DRGISFTRYLDSANPQDVERAIEAIIAPYYAQSNPAPTVAVEPVVAPPPPSTPEAPSNPITVRLGQTMDEVTSALGRPEKIIDLGPKKLFIYKALKVTFLDG